MTSSVRHSKNMKTLKTPEATISVHQFSANTREDPLQQSSLKKIPGMIQNTNGLILVNAGSLRCRTCLDVITTQKCYFLMIMGHLTKTIKEMITFCVPQMAATLSDRDVVCYKCLEAIEICVKFIEGCLEVEQKLHNLGSKEIVINSRDLQYNDLSATFDTVSIDHDYVIKIEPDDTDDSQNLGIQSDIQINQQPSKSNFDESGTNSQPNQQTLEGLLNILEQEVFQEDSQVKDIAQSITQDCFKCDYCSKTCKTEKCLLDHMRRKHKTIEQTMEENNVVSPPLDGSPDSSNEITDETISNKSKCDKQSHKKPDRSGKYIIDPIIKCPFCVEKVRLGLMEAHLREHNQREYNQGQTEITSSRKRRRPKRLLLKCRTCLESFSSKDDLKAHQKNHPPYVCEKCGKGFVQHSTFISHKATHNDPNTFICEYCGKGCKDRTQFNLHLKLHDNKKYHCDKCPKVFNTLIYLRRHLHHIHTSFEGGQCSQCGRIFKSRGSLRSHVKLVHLKLKPYKCEVCEKQFGRADYLRLHKRIHERASKAPRRTINPRNYQYKPGKRMIWKLMFPDISTSTELLPCKFCGQRFQGVPKLKMHLDTHVRRFPCQYCPLTFGRKQYRERHELLHNNGSENLVRCNICWKRMKSEEELEEHIEKKHNQLKYRCHVCGEMFQKMFLLNQHSLREHDGSTEDSTTAKQIIYESLLKLTGSNET